MECLKRLHFATNISVFETLLNQAERQSARSSMRKGKYLRLRALSILKKLPIVRCKYIAIEKF